MPKKVTSQSIDLKVRKLKRLKGIQSQKVIQKTVLTKASRKKMLSHLKILSTKTPGLQREEKI